VDATARASVGFALVRAVFVVVALLLAACGPSSSGSSPGMSRDDFVAACVRIEACAPGAGVTASACAGASASERARSVASFACVNQAAGDCARVLACLAGPAPVASCRRDEPARCLDDRYRWDCRFGTPATQDCAPEACVQGAGQSGAAACGLDACGPQYQPICQGERLASCSAGVVVVADCPPGARCQDGACVGTGSACADAPATCAGDQLVTCAQGREARRHCAADGVLARCTVDDSGAADCTPTGGECAGSDFVDRCNGARLEFCRDGRVVGVDCTALGFFACSLGDPAHQVPSRCAPRGGGNLDAGPNAGIDAGAATDAGGGT